MAYQSEIDKLEERFREKPEQWFAALADVYRKNGDLELAIEILVTWIEKRPTYTSGYIVHGRCLVDMGNDGEAAAVFQKVLELDPENIIALRSLGEIAQRAGDSAGARAWLTRLLEVDPMNEEAHETLEALGGPAESPDVAAPPPPSAPALEAAPEEPIEAATAAPMGLEPTEQFEGPEESPEAPVKPLIDESAPLNMDAPVSMESVHTDAELASPDASGDAGTLEAPAESPEAPVEPLVDEPAPFNMDVPVPVGDTGTEVDPPSVEVEPPAPQVVEPISLAPEQFADESDVAHPGASDSFDLDLDLDEGERENAEPAVESALPADHSLDLIMPDDVTPAAEGQEQVVTTTMADLYVQQGYYDRARKMYGQLLDRDPGNADLAAKLSDLEGKVNEPAHVEAPEAPAQRFSIANTGGQSARDMLLTIAGVAPEGASLNPEPRAQPPATPSSDSGAGAESSFDQFFGNPPEQAADTTADTPDAHSTDGGQGDDTAFQSWLKDLKT